MVKCLNIGKNIGQPIYRSISNCVHMIGMVPPLLHFEKEKTLFAGLNIIWIINQKQQQQLCLILLHGTE